MYTPHPLPSSDLLNQKLCFQALQVTLDTCQSLRNIYLNYLEAGINTVSPTTHPYKLVILNTLLTQILVSKYHSPVSGFKAFYYFCSFSLNLTFKKKLNIPTEKDTEDNLKWAKVTVLQNQGYGTQIKCIYYNLQNNFSWYNCFLKPYHYQIQNLITIRQFTKHFKQQNMLNFSVRKFPSNKCTALLGMTKNC